MIVRLKVGRDTYGIYEIKEGDIIDVEAAFDRHWDGKVIASSNANFKPSGNYYAFPINFISGKSSSTSGDGWELLTTTPSETGERKHSKYKKGDFVDIGNNGYQFCDVEHSEAMKCLHSHSRTNIEILDVIYSSNYQNYWYKLSQHGNWYSECSIIGYHKKEETRKFGIGDVVMIVDTYTYFAEYHGVPSSKLKHGKVPTANTKGVIVDIYENIYLVKTDGANSVTLGYKEYSLKKVEKEIGYDNVKAEQSNVGTLYRYNESPQHIQYGFGVDVYPPPHPIILSETHPSRVKEELSFSKNPTTINKKRKPKILNSKL